ncbi:hypothetical protein [Bacillus sp. FJAT-50079]|uniref:hypothetical protein n=1 Tax=Bacillus sp. FJAT-50079 TaxID=2833577 RepID=UPI001BC9AA02|nr:hypothetical protein [Bacillus sp. FJAT-50079]MBS4209945.1 hypothetical protein [Bacillus sp. FJAT-50079]
MTIQFKQVEEWFTFYDEKGDIIERKTEVRFDPLTGESSRLVFDPGLSPKIPDYTEAAEQSTGKNCPFCAENILKLTPLFPKEIAEDGRLSEGKAILFPNLFPYSKHNGVVVFSDQHYVRLDEFSVSMIKDAFAVAQTYIQKVAQTDAKANYASINWNYLPESGGSILHPHLHIICSESPTNVQATISEKANNFQKKMGKEYFSELYKQEKALGERWIGEKGNVAWIHAFAPKSHNDFIGIFTATSSIDQVTEQDWIDFSEGLVRIFSTLTEQGFASFNLSLQVDPNKQHPIHVRLIPRLTIGNLGTSDINFFQMMHQEPLSYKSPEEIAAKARVHFSL